MIEEDQDEQLATSRSNFYFRGQASAAVDAHTSSVQLAGVGSSADIARNPS